MSTDYASTIIVIYHCSPRDWYFAEVDPETGIYRFGPFDSENAVREVLAVIYVDAPHLEVINTPADYDDVAIWRTATRQRPLSLGNTVAGEGLCALAGAQRQ